MLVAFFVAAATAFGLLALACSLGMGVMRTRVVLFADVLPPDCQPRFTREKLSEGALALQLFDRLSRMYFLDVTVVLPAPPSGMCADRYVKSLMPQTMKKWGCRVKTLVYGQAENRDHAESWYAACTSLPGTIDLAIFISISTPLEEQDVDCLLQNVTIRRVVCSSTLENATEDDQIDRLGNFANYHTLHYLLCSAVDSAHVFVRRGDGCVHFNAGDIGKTVLRGFFECPETLSRWFPGFSRSSVSAINWAMRDVLAAKSDAGSDGLPSELFQAVEALANLTDGAPEEDAFDCIDRACRSVEGVDDFRNVLKARMRDHSWNLQHINDVCTDMVFQMGVRSGELGANAAAPGVTTAFVGARVLVYGDILPDYEVDGGTQTLVTHRMLTATRAGGNVFVTNVRDGPTLARACAEVLYAKKEVQFDKADRLMH